VEDELRVFHPEDAAAGRTGVLAAEDEVGAAVEVDVPDAHGLRVAGLIRQGDRARLPRIAVAAEAPQEKDLARADRGDDVLQAVPVEIGERHEHHLAPEPPDGVFLPGFARGARAAGILEPETAAARAAAVGEDDVGIAVAVHVGRDQRHQPADGAPRVPAPVGGAPRVGRGFEPAELRAGELAAGDEVDTLLPVDVEGEREHPHLAARCGQRLRAPGGRVQDACEVGGCPVHPDAADVPFRAADDVHAAVAVEVDEDRIFDRAGGPGGDGRPGLSDTVVSGMEVKSRHAPLLPSRRDVGKAVAVTVGEAYAVGAGGRAVDGVARPAGVGIAARLARGEQGHQE